MSNGQYEQRSNLGADVSTAERAAQRAQQPLNSPTRPGGFGVLGPALMSMPGRDFRPPTVQACTMIRLGCQTVLAWNVSVEGAYPGPDGESVDARFVVLRNEHLGEISIEPEDARAFGEALIRLSEG